MKHLLNTLFVTSEDAYLALDGENVLVKKGDMIAARYPLHLLQGIISFSYAGASPALMGACAERSIGLAFCTPHGRFLARTSGENNGNVLLRRAQYRMADQQDLCCKIASHFLFGKIYNSRKCVERTLRDHKLRVDEQLLSNSSEKLRELSNSVLSIGAVESARGIEGVAATIYFDCFNEMILNEKESFYFHVRSRRPPMDRVNALLSYAYSLLSHDCASALEAVGLDAYVGFLHTDRPGRASLALDLMEELRACFADRFVLSLINNRVVSPSQFAIRESGAVLLDDEGRRAFLKQWQRKKQDEIAHPFLNERIPWGLVPHVQALLLARYVRGDLDAYPPFLWK